MGTRNKILKRTGRHLSGIMVLALILGGTVFAQQGQPFPRVGVFHWSGAQPEWYAKFDLIISSYYSSEFAQAVKAINPDILILHTRDWNVGARIPNSSAWYVKDSNGNPVTTYGGGWTLYNITSFCPPSPNYDNKRFDEYLPEFMVSLTDMTLYDGIASDGAWDHPYGTTDVDLDGNGVNDWDEHGKAWLVSVWTAGLHRVISRIRELIGPDKIIHINSGRFHEYEWENTNGLTMEHCGVSHTAMSNYLNLYNRWKSVVNTPRTLFYDARGNTKNDFYFMRYNLAMALQTDGYMSYSDAASGEHYYDKYYDEFDVDLGYPITEAAELPSNSDVWVRFFDKGMVIQNVSSVNNTVTLAEIQSMSGYAGPYYRFKGGQDPAFNNGEAFSSVSLNGRSISDGYVGDAIILLKTSQTIVSDIIIDDVDAMTSPASQPALFSGNWTPSGDGRAVSWGCRERTYRGIYNYSYTEAGDGSDYVDYVPTIGVPGLYRIYEWHGYVGGSPDEVTEATNVPVAITYGNGTRILKTIDQNQNYAQWNELGSYYFSGNGNEGVRLSNDANGPVIADAIRFEFIDEVNADDSAPNPPRNLQSSSSTESSIQLNWDPPLATSEQVYDVAGYIVKRDGLYIGTTESESFVDTGLNESSGYEYTVFAVDVLGNSSQQNARELLYTDPDLTAPEVVSVLPVDSDAIEVEFSEKVEMNSAQDINNYIISDGMYVASAILQPDEITVRVVTTDSYVFNAPYYLAVTGVTDQSAAANEVVSSTTEYYGITGDSLEIRVAADDEYDIYVNGTLIGGGNRWDTADYFKVPSVDGNNVIAIHAIDSGEKAGLVAEITFNDQLYVSDDSWKVSTTEEAGWELVDFNDLDWPKATKWGLHGVALPWAQYRNVYNISTTNGAEWIWSADNDEDNVCYLRLTIQSAGDDPPPNPPQGLQVIQP